MNTNPQAIRVFCYGDSNTLGEKPDKTGRYDANVRWTGILQQLLGEGYTVIEEGLGGRTTDLEDDRRPGRNGQAYLTPSLRSHNPIDIVILMLGTNDLKVRLRRSAQEVAQALGRLIEDVRSEAQTKQGTPPQILLVSPLAMNDRAPRFAEFYTGTYDEASAAESKKLALAIKQLAKEKAVLFVDAANVAFPGEDGLHIEEASERPLADLFAKAIRSLSL